MKSQLSAVPVTIIFVMTVPTSITTLTLFNKTYKRTTCTLTFEVNQIKQLILSCAQKLTRQLANFLPHVDLHLFILLRKSNKTA